MSRWPQLVFGIAVASLGVTAAAQSRAPQGQRPQTQRPQTPQMQAPSAPPADRELTRSRFSEARTASKPPPIVSKKSSNRLDSSSGAALSAKPFVDEAEELPKLRPSFETADPRNPSEILAPTTIVAIVGGHHIITGDLMGDVNLTLPPEARQVSREELAPIQVSYLRAFLKASIETKLLYCDFMRQERAKEMFAKLESSIGARFDEQVQEAFVKVIAADTIESREELRRIDPSVRRIADLMVREHLSTMGEVDVALKKYGTSLTKERRRFAERYTAYLVLQKIVSENNRREITREQQLEYYQSHLADFDRVARCKWEKLSVRHSRFKKEDEAWNAIAEMGNRVYLGDVKLSKVAKKSSQTADAEDGGYHDWTGKGSLRSEVINDAIFELPVGRLSDILRDDEGFHIVRVIEREDGGYQPFSDPKTQEIIKKRLEDELITQARLAHVAKLRREIAVWNIFDELNDDQE